MCQFLSPNESVCTLSEVHSICKKYFSTFVSSLQILSSLIWPLTIFNLIIHHEPKSQIYIVFMIVNQFPIFCATKCQSAQFLKPNPNVIYYFLTYFLAPNSKRATLVVNIFWLRIRHETRFDRVRDCETKNQFVWF